MDSNEIHHQPSRSMIDYTKTGDTECSLKDTTTPLLFNDDMDDSCSEAYRGNDVEVFNLPEVPIKDGHLGLTIEKQISKRTFLDATLGGLELLKKDDALCDVTLVVEGEKLKCHKVVLALFSEYFQTMFTTEMKAADQNEMHLTGFRHKTIQKMITYIYKGFDGFTVTDAKELLEVSIFFRVESLRHLCEHALSLVLDVRNVKTLWRAAKRFPECTVLHKSCEEYLLFHFNSLTKEDILYLDKDELVFLISNHNLRVSDEDNVYWAAKIWFEYGGHCRKQYLAEIFQHIRLPFISNELYTDFRDTFRFVKEPAIKPFVEEALKYQNQPSRQMEEISIRTRLRQHYDIEKVLLVIGCKQQITNTNPGMWVWRFDCRRWYTLSSSPCKLGKGYATCRYGKSEVFFSGGQGKRTFLKFDGLTDTILPCTQMITARMSHCMVCVGDAIYVLGGNGFQFEKKRACLVEDKLESVEVWRPSDMTWQQCGHIMSPVSGATACVSGSLILLYGGYINQNDKDHSNLAQFFDVKTNTCGHLPTKLPFKYQNLKSINVSGVTYILANNHIFESKCKDKLDYKMVQTLREKFDTHSFSRYCLAMTNDEKYLYILKKCYNSPIPMHEDTSWDLRQYNIATNVVENAFENIRFCKSGVSMYTLMVRKSILHEKSVVVPNSEGFLT